MKIVDIRLMKEAKKYILTYNGFPIAYSDSEKMMMWSEKGNAESFIMRNDFFIGGKRIDKDKIAITELVQKNKLK